MSATYVENLRTKADEFKSYSNWKEAANCYSEITLCTENYRDFIETAIIYEKFNKHKAVYNYLLAAHFSYKKGLFAIAADCYKQIANIYQDVNTDKSKYYREKQFECQTLSKQYN